MTAAAVLLAKNRWLHLLDVVVVVCTETNTTEGIFSDIMWRDPFEWHPTDAGTTVGERFGHSLKIPVSGKSVGK